jgi:hypothetical protein
MLPADAGVDQLALTGQPPVAPIPPVSTCTTSGARRSSGIRAASGTRTTSNAPKVGDSVYPAEWFLMPGRGLTMPGSARAQMQE